VLFSCLQNSLSTPTKVCSSAFSGKLLGAGKKLIK